MTQPSVMADYLDFVKSKIVDFDTLISSGDQDAELQKEWFLENTRYKLDFVYNLQYL